MKTCSYCGKENKENAIQCFECGTELPAVIPDYVNAVETSSTEDDFFPEPEPPLSARVPITYGTDNGFSFPDWDAIHVYVTREFARSEWHDVYLSIARCWLRQLKEDLGGKYRCRETDDFFLLWAESPAAGEELLEHATKCLRVLESQIKPLLARELYGKRTIIAFSDLDDYFSYLAHFYPDGTYAQSGAAFIPAGYAHIVLPLTHRFTVKRALGHELVHNCLFQYQMPTWVNEGLAQRLENVLSGGRFLLTREMADLHHAYWNEQTIQSFWSGNSFHDPEGSGLSYELAQVLVEVLARDWSTFLDFVAAADWRDAGQDAARRILVQCLGDAVGGFLGDGDWRPNRKAISALIEAQWKPSSPEREKAKA